MTCDPSKATASLTIGMCAYSALPGLCFVRVPNERGRWMLVRRCVADRACSHCGAQIGEPCHDGRPANRRRYTVGTHVARWGSYIGARAQRDKPKLRLRPDDVEMAESEPEPDAAFIPAPLVLPHGSQNDGCLTAGQIMRTTDMKYHEVLALCQSGTVEANKVRNVWRIRPESFRKWWESRRES